MLFDPSIISNQLNICNKNDLINLKKMVISYKFKTQMPTNKHI